MSEQSGRDESAERPGSAKRQPTPTGDMLSDLQRWLLRQSARNMRRELSGQVRRTLGGGKQQTGSADVWDTATNEIPPEVGESPECQWCPICRAARRMRESGPGLGGQISGAGDAVATVVQDAISALDSILSKAGGGGERRSGGSGERPAGGSSARPAGGTGERAAGGTTTRPAGASGARPAGASGAWPTGASGARPTASGDERRTGSKPGTDAAAKSGQSSSAASRERAGRMPNAKRPEAASGADTAGAAAANGGNTSARGGASADLPGSVSGQHRPGGWKLGDRLATEHVIDPDPWAGATAHDDSAVDGGHGAEDTEQAASDAGAGPLAPDSAQLDGQGHEPDDRG